MANILTHTIPDPQLQDFLVSVGEIKAALNSDERAEYEIFVLANISHICNKFRNNDINFDGMISELNALCTPYLYIASSKDN